MRINDMPEFKDKAEILTFDASTTIAEAVDEMCKNNYGAVLITDDENKLLGIFTERDLLRRVCAERMDLEKTTLGDVMTTNIRTADIDDMVSASLRRMSQGRFRHMPVIDEDGNLKGLLSQGDFVAYTMSDAIYRASMSAKAGLGLSPVASPIQKAIAILIYSIVIIGIALWLS